MRVVAAAALLAGCGFSATASGSSGDDTTECIFEVQEQVDPCTAPQPPEGLETLADFTITNDASVDTANGQVIGNNVVTPPPSTTRDGVTYLWTRNFTITNTGVLRGYGTNALVIVATNGIRIDGELDVSSTPLSPGAGANPSACSDAAIAAGPGEQCLQHGGSGGGGGGFGAAGGAGGPGGVGHNCPTNAGRPGGVGGKARAASALRGGCPGADGAASSDVDSMPGRGGFGGGAVALVAQMKIAIGNTGVVHAGGAGGTFGMIRAGAGGGGSGGMIAIAAIEVDLETGSILAANGGGGGGGVDNGEAEPGESGLPVADDDADGGASDGAKSGAGGNGGFRDALAGKTGVTGERGGGGGGGGVGVIRVKRRTGNHNGMTSPAID